MEEQQIREFVHRVFTDEVLRKELATSPDNVIVREGFSSRVAQVVTRLVPHLTLGQTDKPSLWWDN